MSHSLSDQFPREGFAQAALGRHFASCELINGGTVDFVCRDDRGRKWIIEAKGETSSTGLDFRTGLGQNLTAMDREDSSYGVATPDTAKFEHLRNGIAPWVRRQLNLHWLIVGENGSVTIEAPTGLKRNLVD